MRLELTLATRETVPFDHLPVLKGAFHRWSGHNETLHDGISLYSLSWLRGGRGVAGGLRFERGATWSITAYSRDLVLQLLAAIRQQPELGAYGLVVTDVRLVEAPALSAGTHRFRLLSPVFVKQLRPRENGEGFDAAEHLSYDNPLAAELMSQTFRHKLREAGLDEAGASVAFDRSYKKPSIKLFAYKNVRCKASFCPVLVTGSAEQLRFAWCTGIGHSTGIGCGALE